MRNLSIPRNRGKLDYRVVEQLLQEKGPTADNPTSAARIVREIFARFVPAGQTEVDAIKLIAEQVLARFFGEEAGKALAWALADGISTNGRLEQAPGQKRAQRGWDPLEFTPASNLLAEPEESVEWLARQNAKPEALVVKLSSVTPRDVEWIRPQRWPQGKLCLVVGDPGLGKSLLLLDAAARISTGRSWPEGTPAPAGRVLTLTAEDGLDDTVVPRLARMGADLSQIHVLRAIRQDGRERPFNLSSDIDQLRCAIEQVRPVAVFIDPLSAYLGKRTDSHADADVRSVLHPVATLADEFNVAIVALMHLNKATQMRALYRVSGSVAFTAAARSVFAVVEEGETGRRLFVPLKMNLAPKPGALAFRILGGDVPALDWDPDPVPNVDVEAALRGPGTDESGESRNEREDAKAFLNELLNDGPVPANRVKREAKQAMIAEKTLQRAKADLGVRSKREGGIGSEGEWFWYLPKMATSSRDTDDVAILGGSKPESQETEQVSPKMATPTVCRGRVAILGGRGDVATESDSQSQTLGTGKREPPADGALELVAEYPSESEPGLVHRVRRDPTDGSLSCSCPGFQFRNDCKHIARARLDEAGFDLEHVPEDREARLRALGPGWSV